MTKNCPVLSAQDYIYTGMTKDVRVQHSAPLLEQVVQDVEPGFDENPDPHVTLVLAPSLFAHVVAAVHVQTCYLCRRANNALG